MNRSTLCLAALGFSSLVGCGDHGSAGPEGTQRSAIVGGKLSSPVDDAVISLNASGSGCTGTLIAPTVVLTALHCVAEYDPRFRFNCESDGTLPPGSAIGQLGETVEPRGVVVNWGIGLESEGVRGKAIYGTGSTDACHDDLAVVVLERAPAIGDAPLVSMRFGRQTRKGEVVRVVGYGDVEQTATTRGRQVRTDLEVLAVGGPDADTPGDRGALPKTVTVGEGPCHGDSGGPLFSQETGAQIGVYSLLQQSTCSGPSARNTYTLVAPFEALIREALESEGAEPLLEPEEPSGPGGEGGAGAATNGGSVGIGGSETGGGGTGATGEMPSEAGTTTASGTGTTGRGRYKDSSCCSAAGADQRASWFFGATVVASALVASRRRSGARSAA